jgi:hypothetical protein
MSVKIAVIVPDMHVPYHDPRAVDVMFQIIRDLPPHNLEELTVLGDLADFFNLSLHPKLPGAMTVKERFKDEVYECHKMLDRFDSINFKRKVYIEGNHEDRFWRYYVKKAPEIWDVQDYTELLKLKERGYEWIKFSRSNKGSTGQLHRIMGCHLFARHRPYSGGKHTAYSSIDAKHIPIIFGDTHRVQRIITKSGTGQFIEAISNGCLIDFDSPVFSYMDTDNWAQGFSLCYWLSDDPHDYILDFIHIKNGKAVYHGNVYETQKE